MKIRTLTHALRQSLQKTTMCILQRLLQLIEMTLVVSRLDFLLNSRQSAFKRLQFLLHTAQSVNFGYEFSMPVLRALRQFDELAENVLDRLAHAFDTGLQLREFLRRDGGSWGVLNRGNVALWLI